MAVFGPHSYARARTDRKGGSQEHEKEESNICAADDGHLSAADRARLSRQQNRLSERIYDDKHNARTAHYGNNEVGQRRENQQDRIAQGIQSGSTHGWRNGPSRAAAAEHQPRRRLDARGQWRKVDVGGSSRTESVPEERFKKHLRQETQRHSHATVTVKGHKNGEPRNQAGALLISRNRADSFAPTPTASEE